MANDQAPRTTGNSFHWSLGFCHWSLAFLGHAPFAAKISGSEEIYHDSSSISYTVITFKDIKISKQPGGQQIYGFTVCGDAQRSFVSGRGPQYLFVRP